MEQNTRGYYRLPDSWRLSGFCILNVRRLDPHRWCYLHIDLEQYSADTKELFLQGVVCFFFMAMKYQI